MAKLCYYIAMDITQAARQSEELQSLQREAKAGRLANAILLSCKDQAYALAVANQLAAVVLDHGEMIDSENSAKVFAGAHPDVKRYPASGKLLVSDSEDIVSESFIRPIFADRKVFIIESIDNSMDAAQNKLLKVLEEPPANVFHILTCKNIEQVLPTIRSRCNKTTLSKPSKAFLQEFLSGRENAALVEGLCDGFIGKAISLSQIQELPQLFDCTMSTICRLSSSRELLKFSQPLLKYSQHFQLILEIFGIAIEDMLKIKTGHEGQICLKIPAADLAEASEKYTISAIIEVRKLLGKAAKEQSYNGNVTLIIENLLLDILEVKYLCK